MTPPVLTGRQRHVPRRHQLVPRDRRVRVRLRRGPRAALLPERSARVRRLQLPLLLPRGDVLRRLRVPRVVLWRHAVRSRRVGATQSIKLLYRPVLEYKIIVSEGPFFGLFIK